MRDLKHSLTASGHGLMEDLLLAWLQLFGRKSSNRYNLVDLQAELTRFNNNSRVLVQVPMFNEKELYKLSIGEACKLQCPGEKITIQILDDSTDSDIKRLASRGINIRYEIRPNQKGNKAGALKEGLKKHYFKDCDYVAIFDADFQPDPDFLWRTVPFFLRDQELALAHARREFVNKVECTMTHLQEMSLDYHFSVEQEVGSSTYSFFVFNGTVGVWRLQALYDAEGWKDRTTVKDMELAVRASLKGWKFHFIGDLSVKNELPSTYRANMFQQHRWSRGPANWFRKMFKEILVSEE